MRRLLILGAIVLAACVGAAAALPQATPAPTPAAPEPTNARLELFVMDGPIASRIANGARVRIANGWIEARLSGFPPGPLAKIDVLVISGATKAPATADVTVSYEMAEMDHGVDVQHARAAAGGHHAATLELWMVDVWRVTIRVVLEGVTSDVVLLVTPI